MFHGLFGVGKAFKKLPPHHNFKELADNMERLANLLLDRGCGDFGSEWYLQAPYRVEWQLGQDLKQLVDYARDFVPPDTDGLHHPRNRNRAKEMPNQK